jgi:hypothetical protein
MLSWVERVVPEVVESGTRDSGSREVVTLQALLTAGRVLGGIDVPDEVLVLTGYTLLSLIGRRASLVVVQYPETALDPASIRMVMGVLRTLTDVTQVVVETKSPVVLNCMTAEEVTVLSSRSGICRPVEDPVVQRISEDLGFARWRMASPGSYWASSLQGERG